MRQVILIDTLNFIYLFEYRSVCLHRNIRFILSFSSNILPELSSVSFERIVKQFAIVLVMCSFQF